MAAGLKTIKVISLTRKQQGINYSGAYFKNSPDPISKAH